MHKNAGFTLIEMLVVTAMVAILASVGLVSFRSLRSSEEINSARSDTVSKLRETQGHILNGKVIPGVGEAADAYQINLTVGSNNYRIDYDVNGTISVLTTVRYSTAGGNVTLGSMTINGVSAGSAVIRMTSPYGTMLVNGQPYQVITAQLRHSSGVTKNIVIDGISGRIAAP